VYVADIKMDEFGLGGVIDPIRQVRAQHQSSLVQVFNAVQRQQSSQDFKASAPNRALAFVRVLALPPAFVQAPQSNVDFKHALCAVQGLNELVADGKIRHHERGHIRAYGR